MALSGRLNALSTILAATSFICIQDLLKKGIVFHNFASSLQQQDGQKRGSVLQSLKQKYQDSILAAKEIKDHGNGSFINGFRKVYQQDNEQENQEMQKVRQGQRGLELTKRMAQMKQNLKEKIRLNSQKYEMAAKAKSQKLVKKHLIFGGVSALGCMLMPRAFLLLNITYFAAYQIYFFSEIINRNKQYPFLQNLRFQPIWTAYMVGGVALCGVGASRIVKSVL